MCVCELYVCVGTRIMCFNFLGVLRLYNGSLSYLLSNVL